MKRSELEELKLDKDTIDKIMDLNGKDINAAKADSESLKTEKENLAAQVKERDKQIEELKKSAGDNEALTKQIEELQTANKESAKKYAAEIKELKLNSAIESALTGAKAKNITAVKALLKDLKLNDDGTVAGLDDQIKALKEGKDTSFLFDADTTGGAAGLHGDSPKDGDGAQGGALTKDKIMEIKDPAERQQAIAEHHEMFGF